MSRIVIVLTPYNIPSSQTYRSIIVLFTMKAFLQALLRTLHRQTHDVFSFPVFYGLVLTCAVVAAATASDALRTLQYFFCLRDSKSLSTVIPLDLKLSERWV
jgi:hypothetical protein